MKCLAFAALLLVSFSALAVNVQFIGACSARPLLSRPVNLTDAANIGELSVELLENFGIPFQGTAAGINSAFGTPVGLDALEVVSNEEMRSYGWCYKVNGKIPEVFPNAYPLDQKVIDVTWFYGYARQLRGQWVSQCEPAYLIKPKFICAP